MKRWVWPMIGGVIAMASGIGYYAYKKLKVEYALNTTRLDAAKVLAQSIIESMDIVMNFHKLSHESQGKQNKRLGRELQSIMKNIEEKVCARTGWQLEEYYKEIVRRENNKDPEIINMLKKVEDLIESIVDMRKPQITFRLPPELDKETTTILYKWLMLIRTYARYSNIKLSMQYKDKPKEKFIEELKRKEKERHEHEEQLVKRFKVGVMPSEDYKLTMKRAYFTYLTNDYEFEREMERVGILEEALVQCVYADTEIEEFNEDPYELTQAEAISLCDSLYTKYVLEEINAVNKEQKVNETDEPELKEEGEFI